MLKSKVLEILRNLTPDEMKGLRDFVRSPYHNKNKNVMSLFDIIKKQTPSFEDKNFTKELVFKKIFPGKEYNDIVMRILLSDLNRIVEDFLVQQRLEKYAYDYKKYLLSELMERKLDKSFLKIYNNGTFEYPINYVDDSYFIYKYEIEELNKGFNIDRNMQQLNSSNLVDMGRYLIIYFLIKMSSVIHDIDVNKTNFNTVFEEGTPENFLNFINPETIKKLINSKDFKDSEILEIYFCAYMLNSDHGSDEYYSRLKELFFKNISRFDQGAAYNMYLALMNYNGKKHWNDCDERYRRENFELNKDMISRGIYSWSKNEFMTVIMFRSMLSMCTLLRETAWMEFFINNYIDKLAPEQRENMLHFALAKLHFSKNDYSSALVHISKVNFNLFTFKFDVKTLMLQIYFELGYYEEAYSMIDSFRHFLNNNKNVSPEFKEWNVNFLNFYIELLNHCSGRKKADIGLLHNRIFKTSNTASPVWLKDKVTELKGKVTDPV